LNLGEVLEQGRARLRLQNPQEARGGIAVQVDIEGLVHQQL
jgi:hypothetical protein